MIQNSQPVFEANVFVGRQPIVTADLETVAYELLYRNAGEQDSVSIRDGSLATAELIISSFAEIGIERIVGDLRAFINVPETLLIQDPILSLPSERVVLEVLENVIPRPEVLAAVQRLKEDGFTIAIDDFDLRPELTPFLDLADIVKVDLPQLNDEQLKTCVDWLSGFDVRLLAEKVETQEEFEQCRELGFDLFQGFFFCRPSIVAGRRISGNSLSVMRLISELRNPQADLDELAKIIQTEPSLSLKILRFVNSVQANLANPVESIRHAVVMTGIQRIKSICCLSLMSDLGTEQPEPLIRAMLVRARMAEVLAGKSGRPETESFFLVGLFSALDALLQTSMEDALDLIPVTEPVKQALIEGTGPFSEILDCVLACEQSRWPESKEFSETDIRASYLQAIVWAEEAMQGVQSSSE